MSLAPDLCSRLVGLNGAVDLATAVLRELQGAGSTEIAVPGSPLRLRTVDIAGRETALRPFNRDLFIEDPDEYVAEYAQFRLLLRALRKAHGTVAPAAKAAARERVLVGRVLYTTVQSMGFGMDCFVPANQARKNFGSRFEEVIEALLSELGFGHKPVNLALPYEVEGSPTVLRNQVDLVVSREPPVKSTSHRLDPSELVLSVKTSSKDRFAKIFVDKELLRFVTGQRIPVIALFHNDIQRSGTGRVSVTFVAGNFTAYVQRFGPLDGVFYVDPPPHINKAPWNRYLRTFDDLVLESLWGIAFD